MEINIYIDFLILSQNLYSFFLNPDGAIIHSLYLVNLVIILKVFLLFAM